MSKEDDLIPFPTAPVVEGKSSINLVGPHADGKRADFQPLRLVIPDDVARHFLITDIKVGRCSQLFSAACLPASLFAESAPVDHYQFDVVRPGMSISVSAYNMSYEARKLTIRVEGETSPLKWGERDRGGICGLGHTLIGRWQTVNVIAWSQVVFEPRRLYVPPELLDSVIVEEVAKIPTYLPRVPGQERVQLAPDDAAPFDSVSGGLLTRENLLEGGRFRCGVGFAVDPIVTPYYRVRVRVHNDTDAEVAFTGALIGKSYE